MGAVSKPEKVDKFVKQTYVGATDADIHHEEETEMTFIADRRSGGTITTAYLKEALHYDPETGDFTWRGDRPRDHFKHLRNYNSYLSTLAGKKAGNARTKDGYWKVGIIGNELQAHRIAYAMHLNIELTDLPEQIDHADGDDLNNRFANLRPATQNQNQHNKGIYSNNTSGFKGVSFHKKTQKFSAGIRINGVRKHLGLFSTPEAAHAAYVKAANDNFGEFARAA